MDSVASLLADPAAEEAWARVERWAKKRYGREASVESLLFLIGIHSRDGDIAARLKKEMKQDLIMDGTHAVLAELGVYAREGAGWKRIRSIPVLSEDDQERLLRVAIARYLDRHLDPGF
ncbi:MAG: hypothetical protein JJ896_01725 [Rhodothermales bacterium]|nr:hypothetical protein [Rhodothermales bacterium]MBO6778347.1 hypothetical protein [Rhodothermales bacterium]